MRRRAFLRARGAVSPDFALVSTELIEETETETHMSTLRWLDQTCGRQRLIVILMGVRLYEQNYFTDFYLL